MLAVVVAAGLTPNTGAVPATSSCAYGSCPTTNSSSNPLLPWELTLVALVIIAILLAIIVVWRRRGGRTPPPAVAPMEEWSGGGPPGAPEAPEMEAAPFVAGPAAAAAAPAAYLETEEDVAAPPPAAPAPTAPPAGATGGESDIDSLMQELDKISTEILKRGTPKTGKDGATDDADAEETDGGGGSS